MWFNESQINSLLENSYSKAEVEEVLEKAKDAKGLSLDDVAKLITIDSPEMIEKLFTTAQDVKLKIYGKRLVLFAPLYISNYCINNCLYCSFRSGNKEIHRSLLSIEQIKEDTECLIDEGHKRLLLVSGERNTPEDFDHLIHSIKEIYAVQGKRGNIRRINVNVAPLTKDQFKVLHDANIGTYQLFQETYHKETYEKYHVGGPKSNFENRLNAISDAIEAGIGDVGIGSLLGLYKWQFELLSLVAHSIHLEEKYNIGPHTVSIPRIEPANQCDLTERPPYEVSDLDFKKYIAILRLALPYVGIILSTREDAKMRKEALELGVSQLSAGSKTSPGGYAGKKDFGEQFTLGDHRSLDEVIADIIDSDYVPSFCTGCYRKGRVGEHFMKLSKKGNIKHTCEANAILTFAEYLRDFDHSLDPNGKAFKLIQNSLESDLFTEEQRKGLKEYLKRIEQGEDDIYC